MGWVYGVSPSIEEASRWPMIIAVAIVFTTLMTAVGSLRFWVRRQKLSWEDLIILVTMV